MLMIRTCIHRNLVRVETALAAALAAALAPSGCISVDEAAFKAQSRETLSVAAAAGSVTRLRVVNEVGDVEVRSDPSAEEVRAELVRTGRGPSPEEAEAALKELVVSLAPVGNEPGTVLATMSRPPKPLKGRHYSVDWRIVAPAGLRLEVTTNVGDISAEGFTGGVALKSDVGDISASGFAGGIEAQAQVGDMTLSGKGPVTARSDVGDISIRAFVRSGESVTATSNVGDIVLRLPDDWMGKLVAKCNVGDVRVSLPRASMSDVVSKNSFFAAVIGTGNGGIELKSDVGDISVHTASGDSAAGSGAGE